MKYRDAKLLKEGDKVTRKIDDLIMTVQTIEVYGQYKRVKINCVEGEIKTSLFNEEVI